MDALQMIKNAIEYGRQDNFIHSVRFVEDADFDRSPFQEQESDVEGFKTELVDQSGPGMSGDDYRGTMAYQMPDKSWLLYEYS